jgi:poly(A) polymerase/tRNA nucleotidyltransferase (CCA-adding enzyme)
VATSLSEALSRLDAVARTGGRPGDGIYVVGGAVRDALLGRPIDEADIAAGGDAEAFALRAASALGTRAVPIGGRHGVWRLPLDGLLIDIVQMKPALEADLDARDFTINALAVPLAAAAGGLSTVRPAQVIDRHGGLADLRAGVVRMIRRSNLHEDPLRALRAVRIACELGFEIESGTLDALRDVAPKLGAVAAERVGAELTRIFESSQAIRGVRLMERGGLLDAVFPELARGRGVAQRPVHRFDVYDHQLEALRWLDVLLDDAEPEGEAESTVWRGLWSMPLSTRRGPPRSHLARHALPLRLAALLHDAGKPETRSVEPDGRTRFFGHADAGAAIARDVLTRWRFPGSVVERVALLIGQHLRPGQVASPGAAPTPRALHRLHRALGDATPDVCLLFLADSLATAGAGVLLPRWPAYVAHARAIIEWQPPASSRRVARLVDGHGVMRATGLEPGPAVGRILRVIEEAAAAGEVTTEEQALSLAQELAGSAPA